MLSHLLCDNPAAKRRALAVTLSGGRAPSKLLPLLMSQLAGAVSPVAARMLRAALVWAHGCPEAVAALLGEPGHVAVLVDLAEGRLGGEDALVGGLAAALLGCCLLHAPREGPGLLQPALLDVVAGRVGLSQFFGPVSYTHLTLPTKRIV